VINKLFSMDKSVNFNKNMLKKYALRVILVFIFLIIFAGAVWFINKDNKSYQSSSAASYVSGVVTDVISDNTTVDNEGSEGLRLGEQQLKVEVTSGEHKGEMQQITNNISTLYNIYVQKGTRIMLLISTQQNGSYNVSIYGYDRSLILVAAILLFIVTLVLVGGVKGLKSILGLAFTLICMMFILVPMVSKGYSAITVCVVIIIITSIVCFIILDGINIKTVSAMISTVAGVGIAGLFCFVVEKAAHLSGYNMQEAENLILISVNNKINIKGLLTAGILLASLGAVMDIAISVSSSVCEIHSTNESLNARQLFKSGMNVGRDAMGTMANTLIMVFVGSSFNMLLLIFSYGIPIFRLINTDQIAIEILQAIAGSIGIILSVPIAAFCSSFFISKAK